MNILSVSCTCIVLLFCKVPTEAAEDVDFPFQAQDNGYLFEGDMILSKQDIKGALSGALAPNKSIGYSLVGSEFRKWQGGFVPFVIDKTLKNSFLNFFGIKGPTERNIRKAMKEWEKKTCVRFVDRITDEIDYISIKDFGTRSCSSHVGRQGGRQYLTLGDGCKSKSTTMHELGHVLGLYHEQSRPDRDQYVEIKYENIRKDTILNFEKYNNDVIDSRGSPYDYNSIMHYKWNEFAINEKLPTIVAKDSNVGKLGQRSYISDQDAFQINKFYGCSK